MHSYLREYTAKLFFFFLFLYFVFPLRVSRCCTVVVRRGMCMLVLHVFCRKFNIANTPTCDLISSLPLRCSRRSPAPHFYAPFIYLRPLPHPLTPTTSFSSFSPILLIFLSCFSFLSTTLLSPASQTPPIICIFPLCCSS